MKLGFISDLHLSEKTPSTTEGFFKFLKTNNVKIDETIFISINSRWKFTQHTVNLLNNRLINFHSARLPFHKGGAGYSWQVLRHDRINNQTIHLYINMLNYIFLYFKWNKYLILIKCCLIDSTTPSKCWLIIMEEIK